MENELVVVPEEIQAFQKVRKKIDYLKVCDMVRFEPHKKQLLIVQDFQQSRFNVMTLVCGRRFGKSMIISMIAVAELLIPFSAVLLVTPTFSSAKNMFEQVERRILLMGIPIKSKDSKSLTFTTEHESKIVVVTPKSIQNALGFRYSLVIFDESQDIPELIRIFENYLQPAMADFGIDEETGSNFAKAVFIGTARDKANDLYKLQVRARDKRYHGYIHHTLKTSDNPYIPKSYLEQKKRELDPITYQREYEGIWSEMSDNLVYYAFSREKNVLPHNTILEKFNSESFYIVGIDMGFTDNTSYLLIGVEPLSGNLYCIDEYALDMMPLAVHHENFVQIENKYSVKNVRRFIDPSAVQSMSDLMYQFGYETAPALNTIEDGIQKVNSLFHHKQLFVSENCVQLIDELENMVWQNAKTKTVKRTQSLGHYDLALAALRYAVYTWEMQKNLEVVVV